ncbi:serine hydrolase [Streptomyces sp. CB02923]|uniref:serine hydrolase domain-containing protein n=1 Tax=Streptomyces sp. CB02923 TaxID=1718985 RepID=UPI00095D2703|nr:serine hydrolase domain-containing protein [Streptomyces sp. CB02923]OKH97394.1 serine hydrolase [Streptomyces sp. CB02923]
MALRLWHPRRTRTVVLRPSAPPLTTGGHRTDAYVEIGSVTKVLTGTALDRLAAEGVLTPDDPVDRWLDAPRGTGITLRHLAEHTSGLPRLPPLRLPRRDPYRLFDAAALHSLVGRLDRITTAAPGETEEYSNFGYAVLGAALAAAAGEPYERVVQSRVLDPLGIEEMTTRPPDGRRMAGTGRWGRPRSPWTMTGAVLPAGGYWATPPAVAALVRGLLVDRVLGTPALTWRQNGPVTWHNGGTRDAAVFTGLHRESGEWVVVHCLDGGLDEADRTGVRLLVGEGATAGG